MLQDLIGDRQACLTLLGWVVVLSPTLLVALLGIPALVGHVFSERWVTRAVAASVVIGLCASLLIAGVMWFDHVNVVSVHLGNLVDIPHFQFSFRFEFDRLSIPFVILTFVLCGTVGSFSTNYMHREKGFHRYFILFAIFLLGMVIASLAGTIETLFAGWELVGLSSTFLVAFYQERQAPVQNGLWIWSIYRFSDAALLIAAVMLHHVAGHGDFIQMLRGEGPWPAGNILLSQEQSLVVGSLLLIAAAGKSALVPFSGWLPRAMEGPTPSSAIFYGALSVHLGAFLLLRAGPLLDRTPILGWVIVAMGLVTAAFAALAGRVQTDIKSALAFASVTQVGLIVAEIGLGLRFIPLIHIIGHACLRTLQFVRAPSLLSDYAVLENAIGARLRPDESLGLVRKHRTADWLFRFAMERAYLDAWLRDYVSVPFMAVVRGCDRLEGKWTDFLAGGSSRASALASPTPPSLDDAT